MNNSNVYKNLSCNENANITFSKIFKDLQLLVYELKQNLKNRS